ncbi:MAG: VWA domain-containing protein [Acidobacteriota bacterium]
MLALILALNLNLTAADGSGGGLALPGILDSLELGDGLDVALPEELEAYKAFGDGDEDAKRRFRALFWTRRDADVGDFDNPVRAMLFARAREADRRFGGGRLPGRKTDRGQAFVLLGEPAKIEVDGKRFVRFRYVADPANGRPDPIELTFEDASGRGEMRFAKPDDAARILLEAKKRLVVSPGIVYEEGGRSLPEPDVSGSEWIELSTRKDRYEQEGKGPDFPLPATLDVVRASREKGKVLVDVDLVGSDIVRFKAGAGDDRFVTIAGALENRDRGLFYPVRDLAVLRDATDRARVHLQLDVDPGDYSMRLFATEPKLQLFSYREATVRVPDFQAKRLETSSLICGSRLLPEQDAGDHPPELRAGELAIDPGPVASPGEWMMLAHAYGASGPVEARIAIDGQPVDAEVSRSGDGDDQVVAARIPARGRRVQLSLRDPATGHGVVLVRDLDGGASLAPIASRRARPEDFAPSAAGERVELVSPKTGDDPVAVTEAVARRSGEDPAATDARPVAFFVDGDLAMIASAPPYRIPAQAVLGKNSMTVTALPLDGAWLGATGPPASVTLESRRIIYSVRTTLVPIYASVGDPKKHVFVTDLPRQAFEVTENGARQELTHFEPDTDDPMTVAFVVDESYSMIPYLDIVRAALAGFAASLRPVDRGFVVGFNRQVALHADLTSCKGCLVAGILGTRYEKPKVEVNPSGRLMEALEAAAFRLSSRDGRKVLVIASHGNDSGSRIGADRVAELARRYGVMIYALGVNINAPPSDEEQEKIMKDPGKAEKILKGMGFKGFYTERDAERADIKDRFAESMRSASALQALSAASGGRAFVYDTFRPTPIDLEWSVRQIENELAHQYFLGFNPSDTTSRGLRELKVTLPGKDYIVRGRTAYVPQ